MYRETKPGLFARFKKRKPEENGEDTRTNRQETPAYEMLRFYNISKRNYSEITLFESITNFAP